MPFSYGYRRRAINASHIELSSQQAVDLRLGDHSHYQSVPVSDPNTHRVVGRGVMSVITISDSLRELNMAALWGEDDDHVVVGRYSLDSEGNPLPSRLRHRAYRIGQARRNASTGEWEKVHGAYNDSQLHGDASLSQIREGLIVGASYEAEDAFVEGSRAQWLVRRAIENGHGVLYGVALNLDVVDPLLKDMLQPFGNQSRMIAS